MNEQIHPVEYLRKIIFAVDCNYFNDYILHGCSIRMENQNILFHGICLFNNLVFVSTGKKREVLHMK